MAKLLKWNAPHIKLSTIEKITGRTFISFREYQSPEFGLPISIRLRKKDWEDYGVKEALISLGLGNSNVVYINI